MTLASRIGSPSLSARAAPWLRAGGYGAIALLILWFIASINGLSKDIRDLERQPISVAVGRESKIQVATPLSDEEIDQEFLLQILPVLNSLTNKIPKAMDKRCEKDPNCTEGTSEGYTTAGVRLPTLVGIAGNSLTPKIRSPYLRSLQVNAATLIGRELDWRGGESLVYKPFSIESHEKPGMYIVRGGYFFYDKKGNPIQAYEFDQLIGLQTIIPPKLDSSLTSAQKVVAIALASGRQIKYSEVLN